MKKKIAIIDCTPTWVNILPTLLLLLEEGDSKGKAKAKFELKRMAEVADEFVKFQSKSKEDKIKEAENLYKSGNRLAGIKAYRNATGVGLGDAKIYCDINFQN